MGRTTRGRRAGILVGIVAVVLLIGALAPRHKGHSGLRTSATSVASDAPAAPTTTSASTTTAAATTSTSTTSPPTTAASARPPATSPTGVDPLDNPDGLRGGLGAVPTARRGEALALIGRVRTAGRGAKTGYARAQFGPAWTDAATGVPWARNGCDTRNDILRRDLTPLVLKPGTNGCVALSGTLGDPYTNQQLHFERSHAIRVQIDHVMPLSYDWQLGAAHWTSARREQLANDPLNLLAVDGSANESKSDSGPASWLPPSKAIRCAYAVRWAQVSLKYDLAVTPPDKEMLRRQCTGAAPPVVPLTPTPAPAPAPAPFAAPSAPAPTPSGGSVYYQNCAAARAAGAAPLHAGQPGYRAGLDRDHDGVACE